MRRLVHAKRVVQRVTFYVAAVGMFVPMVMMFLTTADTIGRKVASNIPGAFELNQYMLLTFAMLGVAYVHQKGGHVNITILTERMSPRAQLVMESLMSVFALAVFSLLMYQGWKEGLVIMRAGSSSTILQIPDFPFKFLIPLGSFLLCLEIIIKLVDSISGAMKKTNPGKSGV